MSGNRYLVDSNAAYHLLKGNRTIEKTLEKASWIGISIITKIEIFSYSDLTTADKLLFKNFLSRVHIIDVSNTNEELILLIIKIRLKKKLKLPDAVIAATALQSKATLITGDTSFRHIPNLKVINP
ncbi:MAG: PIN domain-containing protein [Sphingobacteriales bacterium]|nr:PIN domain-containing protein [Sphingobacteriales bacterium]